MLTLKQVIFDPHTKTRSILTKVKKQVNVGTHTKAKLIPTPN